MAKVVYNLEVLFCYIPNGRKREREMLTFVVILFNKLDMRRSLGSPPLNYGIVARICSNWFFFLFHQNFWKNREEQPRVVVSLILIPRDSHAKVGNKIPLNCVSCAYRRRIRRSRRGVLSKVRPSIQV